MPKDKLGNELEMGDLVNVEYGSVALVGRIAKMTAGARIAMVSRLERGKAVQEVVTPGTVMVLIELTTDLPNPDAQIASNMLKLVDPNPSERDVFVRAHGMQIEAKSKLVT